MGAGIKAGRGQLAALCGSGFRHWGLGSRAPVGHSGLETEIFKCFPVSHTAVATTFKSLHVCSLMIILSIPLPGIILMGKEFSKQ